MKLNRIIIAILLAQLVTACGPTFTGIPDTPEANQKFFKLGKPYQIDGKWYYPKFDPHYSEVGMASWYGPGFHSEYTANGEVFDKYEMTAAHRTLPLPSMVKVTNLENGRSVVVRVNDRGPFASGRIIDVSKRAAQKLAFMEKGTAKVRVTYLHKQTSALFPEGEHPLDVAKETGGKNYAAHAATRRSLIPEANAAETEVKKKPAQKKYEVASIAKNNIQPVVYVQTGSFSDKNKAREAGKKLQKFGKVTIVPVKIKNKDFFRVRLGPLKNESSANQVVEQISSHGFNNAFVVID